MKKNFFKQVYRKLMATELLSDVLVFKSKLLNPFSFL